MAHALRPDPADAVAAIDLDASDAAWLVENGVVELFVLEGAGEGLAGRRRPLFTVPAGEAIVGLGHDEGMRLIAVPSLGAGWRPLPLPLPDDLRDAWADHLVRLVAPGGGGRVRRTARADLLMLEAGELIGGTAETMWLTVEAGTLRIAGGPVMRPGDPPLLWRDPLWAVADEATTVATFAVPGQADPLAMLGRIARAAIRQRLADAARDDAERWAARSARDEAALSDGLAGLVRAARRGAQPPSRDDAGEDALAAALRPLLAVLGHAPPETLPPGLSPAEALAAQRVRSRQVLLRGDWARTTGEPLLGFLGDARQPVALLPGRPWRVVGTGIDAPLDADLAAALQPDAWQVYRALPDRPAKMREFLALGGRGSLRDLGRAALLGVAGAGAGFAMPLALQALFEELVPNGDRAGVWGVLALLLAVAVVEGGFHIANAIALLRIESRFEVNGSPAMMDRVLRLPTGFFRDHMAGDLSDRLLCLQNSRRMIGDSMAVAWFSGSLALGSAIMLVRAGGRLGVVGLAIGLAVAGITIGIQRLQFRAAKSMAMSRGRMESVALQLIGGMAKLRAAAAERRALAWWARQNAVMVRRNAVLKRYSAVQHMLDGAMPLVAAALIYWAIAHGGTALSTGQVVAFSVAFGQLIGALLRIGHAATQMGLALPMVARARPLLQAVPEGRPQVAPLGRLDGAIALRHLGFRYDPEGPLVLDDVTADIPAGGFVAIVGASGSGKSTLMRCLLGFEQPQSGAILFDGRPMEEIDPGALRRQIGTVLQNGRISAGSILENILGPAALSVADAWDAARAVGLAPDIEAMPMGMHTVLTDGGGTLSGGQRQRLMIARALVHRPRILLFDEATSALDNRTQSIVTDTLRSLAVTRIVIAHRLSTIEAVDRVLVMDDGRIVQAGSYRDLLDAEGAFATLARRQLAV